MGNHCQCITGSLVWKHKAKILNVLSVVLTLADIVSDLVMAFDYLLKNETLWFYLTLTFVILPLLSLGFILSGTHIFFGKKPSESDIETKVVLGWRTWKTIELALESGPQLLLQLYIMALPNQEFGGSGQL